MTKAECQLIEDYLSDNYLKAKRCVCKTLKVDYIDDVDFDEYRGVVDEALIKAAKKYDPSKGVKFDSFAYLNIASSIKTMMTYNNRICRLANHRIVSLDTVIDQDGNICLKDTIVGMEGIVLEDETGGESDRVKAYFSVLSNSAAVMLKYLLRGYSWNELEIKFNLTKQKRKKIEEELSKKEYVDILRHTANVNVEGATA